MWVAGLRVEGFRALTSGGVIKAARGSAPKRACPGLGVRRCGREIGNLLPNNRRQRRTCYALCHILYPVSAALTSIFRMDSNSTSYIGGVA